MHKAVLYHFANIVFILIEELEINVVLKKCCCTVALLHFRANFFILGQRRAARAADDGVNVATGFIMDGVVGLRNCRCSGQTARCTPLEYVHNPVYYGFDHPSYGYTDGVGMKDGSMLHVHVSILMK